EDTKAQSHDPLPPSAARGLWLCALVSSCLIVCRQRNTYGSPAGSRRTFLPSQTSGAGRSHGGLPPPRGKAHPDHWDYRSPRGLHVFGACGRRRVFAGRSTLQERYAWSESHWLWPTTFNHAIRSMADAARTIGHRSGALRKLDGSRSDRKSTRLNSSHVSISYAVF